MPDDAGGLRTSSKAKEYWARAREAKERADKVEDFAAKRTWREVATQWREMALSLRKHDDWVVLRADAKPAQPALVSGRVFL